MTLRNAILLPLLVAALLGAGLWLFDALAWDAQIESERPLP